MKDKQILRATAWTEKVVYIECPNCELCECLGTGIIINMEHWECDKCKKKFEIDDCTS